MLSRLFQIVFSCFLSPVRHFFATLLLVKLAPSLLRFRSPLHDPLDHRVSPFDHRVSPLDHHVSSFDHRVSSFDHRVSQFDHRVSPFVHQVSLFNHRLVDLVFGVCLEVSHSTFVSGLCFVSMYHYSFRSRTTARQAFC